MNHFCSTLDSVETNCSADPAVGLDHRPASTKLEFALSRHEGRSGVLDSYFRSAFHRLLGGIKSGSLTVTEGEGTNQQTLGSNTDAADPLHAHVAIADPLHAHVAIADPLHAHVAIADPLHAHVAIADPVAYRRMITGSTLGAAESYADGQWSSDDLTSLIRIMIRNLDVIQKVDRSWSRAKNLWNWFRHSLRRNTLSGSRRNIHDHYDLGNDFYQLFLDPTLSYSSAIFPAGVESAEPQTKEALHEASIRKLDVVRQKLDVCSSDHVLEIGTGWGAMAIHLASTTGCRVTTTTISQEQYRHAVQQVAEAGLTDQITVLQQDYRELTGSYDKIVSIEMIEAVGHQYFDQFFATCSTLLKPGGKMLLQSILIAGQHYQSYLRRTDFIRRYIFPGGCLPSIGAIQQSVDRVTDFQMTRMDDYSHDYAVTLKIWRQSFMSQLTEVRRLGYDQKFIRLWHFYLCYCEAAFRERRTNLAQIVFDKPSSFTEGNSAK